MPLSTEATWVNIAEFSRHRHGPSNVKGILMKKIAMVAAMAGTLGLSSVAATSPAEAHWRGAGGRVSPAAWLRVRLSAGLPPRQTAGDPATATYGAGYYGGPYAYDYGYDEPYRWGGGYTITYYTAPLSYGYRYRRIVRPAYAYYGGAYPVVRHRWHPSPLVTPVDPMQGRLRSGRGGLFLFPHHHPPESGSCRSKASCRSGALFDSFVERFGCGRDTAEKRAGAFFLISAEGAAGMATMASRTCCCGWDFFILSKLVSRKPSELESGHSSTLFTITAAYDRAIE